MDSSFNSDSLRSSKSNSFESSELDPKKSEKKDSKSKWKVATKTIINGDVNLPQAPLKLGRKVRTINKETQIPTENRPIQEEAKNTESSKKPELHVAEAAKKTDLIAPKGINPTSVVKDIKDVNDKNLTNGFKADNLYQEFKSDDKKSAVIVSTNYHSESVRNAPNKGAQYICDATAHMKLDNGVQLGCVCDGCDHTPAAAQASQQISKAAMELGQQDKYLIKPNDTPEVIKNKLTELAKALREIKLKPNEMGEVGSTSLLLYSIVPMPNGKKRMVGINIGDSAMMVYRNGSNKLELASEPQQKFGRRFGGGDFTPASIPKSGNAVQDAYSLAKDEDIRPFEMVLEAKDRIIPSSDGLLDSVKVRMDNDNPILKELGNLKLSYLSNVTKGIAETYSARDEALSKGEPADKVNESYTQKINSVYERNQILLDEIKNLELSSFKAKTTTLGNQLEKQLKGKKDVPAINMARALFKISDDSISETRKLKGEIETLKQEKEKITQERVAHLRKLATKVKTDNAKEFSGLPDNGNTRIQAAKDADKTGIRMKTKMDELGKKIEVLETERRKKFSYLADGDDFSVGVFE